MSCWGWSLWVLPRQATGGRRRVASPRRADHCTPSQRHSLIAPPGGPPAAARLLQFQIAKLRQRRTQFPQGITALSRRLMPSRSAIALTEDSGGNLFPHESFMRSVCFALPRAEFRSNRKNWLFGIVRRGGSREVAPLKCARGCVGCRVALRPDHTLMYSPMASFA